MERIYFDTLDSTNNYCKQNYEMFPSFCYVIANKQTSGRGRFNRIWLSDEKNSLTLSIFIKENLDNPVILSMLAAISVVKTLESFNIKSKIKWPNDILVNSKKICGILLEGITNGTTANYIIGIGLNVNNELFDEQIKQKATSMINVTNTLFSLSDVEKKLIETFEKYYKKTQNQSFELINLYKSYSCVINKNISFEYQSNLLNGKVLDILDDGSILIKTNDELLKINYGEITLKNYY